MSIVQELIRLTIDTDDTHEIYHYVPMSKEYKNYTRQKKEASDLYTDLAIGAVSSVFHAARQTFFKASDKAVEKEADRLVKDWVIGNPNMTWTN